MALTLALSTVASAGPQAPPVPAPATPARPGAPAAPATPKRPVVDEYHGQRISDDYRWLEDFSDPTVKAWNAAQNRHTRHTFDGLKALPAIQRRVTEVMHATLVRYFDLRYREPINLYFARKFQPPREQPLLVVLKSPDDVGSERVLLDPVAVDPGGTTTIDFYAPSPDGKLVAVSLSQGGTEDGTVHIYDTATGKPLPDKIPRVNGGTAGGSVTWRGDGSGFYYTRYPRKGERPEADLSFFQQVYYHKLGTATDKDTYALGKDFPRIAETMLSTSEDGRHVLAEVENGDGGEYAHYLLGPDGKWQQLTRFADKVMSARFGRDGALYLISRQDAPRGKLLRLPLAAPRLSQAKVIVPEGEAVIEAVVPTRSRVYVADLLGGVSQVRLFDFAGKSLGALPLPTASSVGQLLRLSAKNDDVLYNVQTFTEPPTWLLRTGPGEATRTAISTKSPVDMSGVEVVRDFAVSRDGTKVPLSILLRKGTPRDGNNPTVLTGYGGFGVSLTPHFQAMNSVWLEQGGINVIANLRGGGEYGEAWHLGGNLTQKQNVFDDFIACARYLIDKKYTSPARLAIEGGSNGGLLMGAVVTQRPDLFRAVVAYVGLYDMLRFSLYPNGAFNVTEYGSVKDPAQFQALYAYSPYHRVKDGAAYPAMLFVSGENDPRVNPADSRKMVARLQAASSSGRPILLRTSSSSGHGGSSLSERIREAAESFAFLFDQLGVTYKDTKKPR